MNVVDSSGWLEYFADAPNADFFAPAIDNTPELLVPSVCIYEVFKRVHQQRGEDAALHAVAIMLQGLAVDLDSTIALNAAKTSIELRLPMADSIILTTAQTHGATLWTQDADFKDVAGVRYVEKTPDNPS
jgi:toxin FitB